jgi:AraC family transcriptional regulator
MADTNTPEIKTLNDRTVAYVSFKGNYIGNSEVFKDLIGKVMGWAGPKGILSEKSLLLASYQDDPQTTAPEDLTLEICLEIDEATEVEGEIKKKVLPGGKYVVMHAELKGPDEYGPAWEKIVEWMKENNVEIDMSRPSYELYLNDPNEHPEKHHIIDICMSAK